VAEYPSEYCKEWNGNRAKIPTELLQDYLIDQDRIKGAFDLVPESGFAVRWIDQAGAEPHQRITAGKLIEWVYKRSLKTRVGEITFDKPQLRDSAFEIKYLIVTGGLKLLNSGGIKLTTCQSLISKLRGCADAGHRVVPNVARFIQL
jgi:hypothetical protein